MSSLTSLRLPGSRFLFFFHRMHAVERIGDGGLHSHGMGWRTPKYHAWIWAGFVFLGFHLVGTVPSGSPPVKYRVNSNPLLTMVEPRSTIDRVVLLGSFLEAEGTGVALCLEREPRFMHSRSRSV